MEELAKRLLATEGQKMTFAEGDEVLSDEQMEVLLDRSVSRLRIHAFALGSGVRAD